MRPASLMKMPSVGRVATLALLVLGSSPACSGGEQAAYARSAESVRGVTIVDPAVTPYTPATVTSPGRVAGAVRFTGEPPRDSAVIISRDERVCGNTLRQSTVQVKEDRVAGAIVWLADIRSGRPVPLQRRFELVQTRCTFGPIVQVAIAGGALNVRTHDPITTSLVVIDTRTLDTLVVLPFSRAGSLVPLDAQLRRPAMLEIRSVTHPWMEAWVAVLDHPYHATTDREGEFSIEGIPAGTYQVKAWHPRFGLAHGSVAVRAGAAAQLDLVFGGTADTSAVARSNSADAGTARAGL